MSGIVRKVAYRGTALAMAVLLILGQSAASGPARLFAAASSASAGAAPPTPPRPQPRVVRELEEKDTEDARSQLLSDGSRQLEAFSGPQFARNASGAFVPADTSLELSLTAGTYRTVASPVEATFASASSTRTAVTVTHDGVTATLDLLGSAERVGSVLANRVVYPQVADATSLVYETAKGGVKDTLLLASSSAPTSFTFRLGLLGSATLSRVPGGGLVVERPGAKLPAFTIGSLRVIDASGTPCVDATTTISPGGRGAWLLRYSIPRAWLSAKERAFPVRVDPALLDEQDTYVSSANPSAQYGGQAENRCGQPTAGDQNRVLMRFNATSLKGAYVHDATFQAYASYLKTTSGSRTYLGKINGYWTAANTWASKPSYAGITSQMLYGTGWYTFDVRSAAQDWANWSAPYWWESGLQLYQDETGGQGTNHYKRFYSENAATYNPKIMVHYSTPSILTSTNASRYDLSGSDIVTATASVNASPWPEDVRSIEVRVNGAETDPLRRRGHMGWFAYDPGSGWTTVAAQGGGYFAADSDDASYTVPLLDRCRVVTTASGQRVATFAFRLRHEWGNQQENTVDYCLRMGEGSDWYSTGWRTGGAEFGVTPAPLQVSVTTTASAAWSTAGRPNDDASSGRGSVRLSWQPKPVAAGYDVYLFDGRVYSHIATLAGNGNTSWSSAGKGLFPPDSWISDNATALASGARPWMTGAGLDLRDDPRFLYRSTPGTSADDLRGYLFKVVPYVAAPQDGDTSAAAPIPVPLDCRTMLADADPRHTDIDLGGTSGGDSSLRADTGALTLSACDIEVRSYGPDASLTRHYSSQDGGSGSLAPGWRFTFEQGLVVGPAGAVFTDEDGDRHIFRRTADGWAAPIGFPVSMTARGSGWRLRWPNGEVRDFDAGGVLTSLADSCGNAVSYLRTGSEVDIVAANGATVAITFDGAKATSARFQVGSLGRYVSYSASASALSVTTSYSDSTPGITVSYGYSARLDDPSALLTSVSTPGIASLAGTGVWSYGFSGGALSAITGPEFREGHPATSSIAYDSDGGMPRVTLTRQGAQVGGVSCGVDEHWWLNPTGTLADHADQHVCGEPEPVTRYTYSPEGYLQSDVGPLDASSHSVLDALGDQLTALDQDGNVTASTFDGAGRTLQLTDPLGSTTTRTYDSAGNLLSEEQQLNDTDRSHRGYAYDERGRVTSQTTSLSADLAAVETYTYAKPFDSPTTATRWASLAASGTLLPLTETADFDEFGDEVASTDASGCTTNSRFDAAGRVLSVTDPAGLCENHTYDALGNETARWESAAGTSAVTGYTETRADAYGRSRVETLCDGSAGSASAPGREIESCSHLRDSHGRETESSDSLIAGLPARTEYDALGNITRTWTDGQPGSTYDDVRATRARFDLAGQELVRLAPGSVAAATVTTYFPSGAVAAQTTPDGLTTNYTFDACGNEVRQVSSLGAVRESTYDRAGRLISSATNEGTGPQPLTTVHYTYDLADRPIAAARAGAPSWTTEYNELGWVLRARDADGVEATRTYDAAGRTIRDSVAGSSTTFAYNADGSESSVTGPTPELRRKEIAYDAFGRTREVRGYNSKGLVSDVISSYDSLDRLKSENDAVRNQSAAYSYPVRPGDGYSEHLVYGGVETTVSLHSRDVERARSSSATFMPCISRTADSRDAGERETGWTLTLGTGRSTATAAYDDAGRLSTLAEPGQSLQQSYESAGKIQQVVGSVGTSGTVRSLTASYIYGADGRLSSSQSESATCESMTTSNTGSFVSAQNATGLTMLTYDSSDRAQAMSQNSSSTTTFGWDVAHGWRTSSRRSGESSVTMSYTEGSRVASVLDPNRKTSATYEYDPDGLRTTSTIVTTGSVCSTTDVAWNYDGGTLLSLSATRVASGCATPTAWQITYLRDATGRPYAAAYREGAPALTTATVMGIATTPRGDVVALTDDGGRSFATYSYDAWGNQGATLTQQTPSVSASLASNIAARQPLRYAGYVCDSESGTYYLSARSYDPSTRQFTSKDPAESDGEASPYQYCEDDPVNSVDPSGLYGLHTGALGRATYDRVLDKIVDGAFWLLHHIKGYSPDTAAGLYGHRPGCKPRDNGTGYTDCSGLVTWIMWKAGVFPHKAIANWSSAEIFKRAPRKGRPSVSWFNTSNLRPWHPGDIVQTSSPNHIALIISYGKDPYIAESSPTYDGVGIHRLGRRRHSLWPFGTLHPHSGRFFWLSHPLFPWEK